MSSVEEMVFVTLSIEELNGLVENEDVQEVLLDHGITDRQGYGYLVLQNGQEARTILDDLLEEGILLDYTVFGIEVAD